jgi:putative phosphoesterase
MHIVVLSDTHIRRGGKTRLTAPAYAALDGADLVLHCGDVLAPEFLDELSGFAPLHAVLGNNDAELSGVLATEAIVDVDGVSVGMIHDAGPSRRRRERLRAVFPTCDVIVFGHSHIPVDELTDGVLLMNPGSATQRRRQPHRTIGLLDVRDGALVDHEIVAVDEPG